MGKEVFLVFHLILVGKMGRPSPCVESNVLLSSLRISLRPSQTRLPCCASRTGMEDEHFHGVGIIPPSIDPHSCSWLWRGTSQGTDVLFSACGNFPQETVAIKKYLFVLKPNMAIKRATGELWAFYTARNGNPPWWCKSTFCSGFSTPPEVCIKCRFQRKRRPQLQEKWGNLSRRQRV